MSLAYAMRSQHLKQNPNMTMFDDWDAAAASAQGFQQAAAASGETSPGEGVRRKSALPVKPSAAIPA